MKVTLNWLREFVAIEMPADRLAEVLTMAGLEVDAIVEYGDVPVRIGRIVEVEPHPRSDHLVVCRVTTGDEPIPVVCGAPNAKRNAKVVFAPAGTILPGGMRISRAEIRGQLSCGMLCSGAELGISADHSGILILPDDAPLGTPFFEFAALRDTVLDVALTANRGDCLSVLGVAREIAAVTGARLMQRKPRVRESRQSSDPRLRVSILDRDLCPRYAARIVGGVRVAPSPAWMRCRLEAVGIRALNNAVDVTNYVMMERGQPLHTFDLSSLRGSQIVVRRAGTVATLTTLDGEVRELVPDDLLICDRERPVALAGVMGGANSEVQDGTTELLIESAYFVPETVRRVARRLNIHSEASHRFERGVDPAGTLLALDRAVSLLTRRELCGGRAAGSVVDEYAQPIARREVPLRSARIDSFLGVSVPVATVEDRLRSIGAKARRTRQGVWTVTAPSFRADLTQEVDLIEEIARLGGYDAIPLRFPAAVMEARKLDPEGGWVRRVRECLAGQGLVEMFNFSFVSTRLNELFSGIFSGGRPIPLLNPLSAEGAELRLSVLGVLVRALQRNLRQGERNVAVFELGKVFCDAVTSGDGGRRERQVVAGLLSNGWPMIGLNQRELRIDFTDLKGVVETVWQRLHGRVAVSWVASENLSYLHPGKSAQLYVEGRLLGVAGALHPDRCAEFDLRVVPWLFELDLATMLHYVRPAIRYQPLPRFPSAVRDLALTVNEELPVQAVVDAVDTLKQPLIETMRLFDLYHGAPIPAHKKGLAYSIAYRAADRTLTASEVDAVHDQVVAHLVRVLDVEVRL